MEFFFGHCYLSEKALRRTTILSMTKTLLMVPSKGPLQLYLYYRPNSQNISDSFHIDFRLEGHQILHAEVFDFPITVGGNPVANRWNELGDIVIDGDSVTGFSGSNDSSLGGIKVSNDGSGVFRDEGYDASANAFQIGTITITGIPRGNNEWSTEVFDQGIEVFPEHLDPEVQFNCVLDPPYAFFEERYPLVPGRSPVFGTWHCIAPWGNMCDGTLWYRFDPETNGLFTCNTFGSYVADTTIEVYTGEVFSELVQIASVDDVDGSTQSRITFPVLSGENYVIRVLGDYPQQGPAMLGYEFLEGAITGDFNSDGLVNLLDVSSFVDLIGSGTYEPRADMNYDGDSNLADVPHFIDLLTGS